MKTKYSKVEESEQNHFNKSAQTYDVNYNYQQPFTKYKISKKSSDFVDSIKKYVDKDNLTILEIGCGTGEYTKNLSRLLPKAKIIGLDISEQMIIEAREKCIKCKNVKFVVGSAYSTGFSTAKFDIVCGFYVLHHIDERKLAREVSSVLKKDGLVYFFEPNILNPIVYLVKSNKIIKNIVGDSPNEWAINPINISNKMKGFKTLSITTSEFIWPIDLIPLKFLIVLDKITMYLRYVPMIKYLGGSVQLLFQKNENSRIN